MCQVLRVDVCVKRYMFVASSKAACSCQVVSADNLAIQIGWMFMPNVDARAKFGLTPHQSLSFFLKLIHCT